MFDISPRERPNLAIVVAARPNFMKAGPIIRALGDRTGLRLVHTGQHYDIGMSETFFNQLGLPEPDVNLGIGSGAHGEQTGAVMAAFESYLLDAPADAVVVVGDVNSTLGAALAAVKLRTPVAHVEAGLRSRDWTMPEEVNRVVTDRVARWLLTPSPDANANLAAEGIPDGWVHLVGNVMVDTLLANIDRARAAGEVIRERLGISGEFGLLTVHRPSNVDEPSRMISILDAVRKLSEYIPFIFPVHPRLAGRLAPEIRGVKTTPPLSYLEFVGLMQEAVLVLTDSGGVQEETSVLGTPCLTLRDNTERPITCELGTNHVVGTRVESILSAASEALDKDWAPAEIPYWDGKAGERIAEVLSSDLMR